MFDIVMTLSIKQSRYYNFDYNCWTICSILLDDTEDLKVGAKSYKINK